jgi:hypothetical protein
VLSETATRRKKKSRVFFLVPRVFGKGCGIKVWCYGKQVAEYFWELAEHDGNMEQTPKSKKFEAPSTPHRSKRPSTKKMTAFDWPINIICNAFNPKHLDVFYCWKKKFFMSKIAPLVFAMCLFNTPITTSYFVVPCQHSCFFFSLHFLSSSVLFGHVFVFD